MTASSAFPPFLSPAQLSWKEAAFVPNSGQDLQFPPYNTRVRLTDGGVYDNLGLETAWKRYRTILVSDAGGRLEPRPRPWANWVSSSVRVEELVYSQVGSLRKRQTIAAFLRGDRKGAYWGIWSHIAHYDLPDALPCPPDRTLALARTPTRLRRLPSALQERIVNWGYGICDAAVRKHLGSDIGRPLGFPYPCGV